MKHNDIKISFGIIVFNGEPFVEYNLNSIYPYAHEIIVVEGGHEKTKAVATKDGHSVDGTLQKLYKFKKEKDIENKLKIIVNNDFWPQLDGFGDWRTYQSRIYSKHATGNYLWQIDIDDFYKSKDIEKIIEESPVSKSINTSFIERANLTLRNHNRKLARKTLCFAKRKRSLEAQTSITVAYYNYSRPHRGLNRQGPNGAREKRTPAMAANVIDRVWTISEVLEYPLKSKTN